LSTFELSGKSIGLVGLGHIGGHVARILQGFDARVSYHDAVRASVEKEHAWGVRYVELSELLQASDIISIHCPLNDRTRGMFGASQFAAMKPGAIVINTSRGPVIDECALAESLKSGHLMGAGLDVFAHEPLSLDSPLTQLDNVVLTPHVAGVTYDAFGRMMREAFGNIVHYEAGRYAEIEERKLNY
jgi:D-3-phosphoglycerate dehydrogenase